MILKKHLIVIIRTDIAIALWIAIQEEMTILKSLYSFSSKKILKWS